MYKELFTKINQLPMHNPGINLMEKYFMTLKLNSCEYCLYYWVPCYSFIVKQIKKLTALNTFLNYLFYTFS